MYAHYVSPCLMVKSSEKHHENIECPQGFAGRSVAWPPASCMTAAAALWPTPAMTATQVQLVSWHKVEWNNRSKSASQRPIWEKNIW